MKLRWVALALLAFGLVLTVFSYQNLYTWSIEPFNSGMTTITAHSSNEHGFYYAPVGASVGYVNKVYVSVDNVAGKGWINHPFEMSLLNGQGDSIMVTTKAPPEADYTFDIPSSWNSLGGVRVSNPEDYTVTVNVIVIFHSQTLNTSWVAILIMGLILTAIGIMLIVITFRREH